MIRDDAETADSRDRRRERLEDYIHAEQALDWQRHLADHGFSSGSLTFRSVSDALGWFVEAKEKLRGPNAMHPRTERAPNGRQVCVSVDGGKGGDIDQVLATIATVETLLERLPSVAAARSHRTTSLGVETYPWVLLQLAAGRKQSEIGRELGVDQATVSRHAGRAQALLAEQMRDGGVLAPRPIEMPDWSGTDVHAMVRAAMGGES